MSDNLDAVTSINEVTMLLIEDLKDLRAGKINNADARVRAQLGREILRSYHLQLEGMRFISSQAKPVAIEDKTVDGKKTKKK